MKYRIIYITLLFSFVKACYLIWLICLNNEVSGYLDHFMTFTFRLSFQHISQRHVPLKRIWAEVSPIRSCVLSYFWCWRDSWPSLVLFVSSQELLFWRVTHHVMRNLRRTDVLIQMKLSVAAWTHFLGRYKIVITGFTQIESLTSRECHRLKYGKNIALMTHLRATSSLSLTKRGRYSMK